MPLCPPCSALDFTEPEHFAEAVGKGINGSLEQGRSSPANASCSTANLTPGGHLDIAVRDFVLSVAAFTLARLEEARLSRTAHVTDGNRQRGTITPDARVPPLQHVFVEMEVVL